MGSIFRKRSAASATSLMPAAATAARGTAYFTLRFMVRPPEGDRSGFEDCTTHRLPRVSVSSLGSGWDEKSAEGDQKESA
jgi:hypothetical protein